jgi:putative DNA methylase
MSYRKKLIEVALPLEEINIASAREKSIRHGHPSTLHLWWARRPLATCRAVLFSSIIDDPGEEGVPQGLLEQIDLLPLHHKYRHLADEEPLGSSGETLEPEVAAKDKLAKTRRYRLFTFIERLVQWENSNDPDTLAIAHSLIREACRKPAPPELSDYFDILEWAFEQVGDSERGYDRWGDVPTLGDQAGVCRGEFKRGSSFSLSAEELRGVLFFEQRNHRMTDVSGTPSDEEVAYLRALYHEVRRRWSEVEPDLPPVLDPFCGGGSIPLEAQRLGLEAHGSDLNPVAVLITKAMIEIPPKFAGWPPMNPESRAQLAHSGGWRGAQGLAEDVRSYGQWMRDEAERRIGHLYPKVEITAEVARERPDLRPLVGQRLTVIAWLWARTVPSPDPAARGAHIPLVRSFVLSSKKGKEAWVEPVVDSATMQYRFEVRTPLTSANGRAQDGTIGRQGGRCLLTGSPMPFDHIRAKAKAGNMSQRLMAVVAEGARSRVYLSPTALQEARARELPGIDAPTSALPDQALGFRVQAYGMTRHRDLFTDRQLVALTTFSDLVGEAREKVLADAIAAGLDASRATAYADAIATYLAFVVDKGANLWSSITSWMNDRGALRETFARQAIPMVWDFAEANPFSGSGGGVDLFLKRGADALDYSSFVSAGVVDQADATKQTKQPYLFSTDPPYFDNIGYADLSDFFYVWLRRSLGDVYPDLFSTLVTPKADELIATPYRHDGSKEKATKFFETGLREVFRRMRNQGIPEYPTTVYYAFKQSETEGDEEEGGTETASTGWEAMLQGLVDTGFAVNGTWPTRESAGRLIAKDTNALGSCIVLVCRPRLGSAESINRRQFVSILSQELKPALVKLTQGNLAPVDLAQAAIGPGMAVFSRYASVLEADGKPMKVRSALGLINQALEEALSEQEGWYDSQTRWAVTWFKQRGFQEGPYGEAETLATAKDAPVNTLAEAGVIRSGGGKVKLLSRDELNPDYDPASDKRTTIWEATQYVARALDQHGELGAARMMRRFRETKPDLDVDRARELAYRLYAICDQKRWTQEARVYNALVLSWSDIEAVSQTDDANWNTVPEAHNLFTEGS